MTDLPVLFLPGTLCTGAVFDSQLKALAAVAKCVNVVPFLYESSMDEMAELAEQRIPRDSGAAIVGFSMGGMVAMAIARRNPELVARLALINTNSHAEIPERHAARMDHLMAARKHGIEKVISRNYLPRYLHRQQAEHRALILNMAGQLGNDCFQAQLDALATRPDSSQTLRDIKCPTLILGSANDPLCPAEGHREMHRMVDKSELAILENCGHFSMLEQPEEVSQALLNWYSQPDQSR